MANFELKFVDTISASPTTRLDLNSTSSTAWHTMAEGTDFGTPPLRRAVAGSLLRDGEVIPASAYGNRLIRLQLDASHVTSADDVGTLMQNLHRELNRPTNFLRYRVGTDAGLATNSVTFRTLRSPSTSVIYDGADRMVSVQVLAEPFALGEKETLTPVTVNNDPAAAQGQYLDITGIKGDVETPAYVLLSSLGAQRADIIIGTRRRGTPSAGAYWVQAEALTSLIADTSLPGNAAAMSGAGSNYMRTTFATTAAMADRMWLSTGLPAASGTDIRGTYRLYAVCDGNAGTYQIKWSMQPLGGLGSGLFVESDTVTFNTLGNTDRQLVDLGRVTFPIGPDPTYDGYSGTEKTIGGAAWTVAAARTAGAATLDWDYFVLVPDDAARGDDWCLIQGSVATTNVDYVIDGPNDLVYAQTVGSTTMPAWNPIPVLGRLPRLSPNQTNRWIMLRPDSAAAHATYGDVKTKSMSVTVSYWPRYLTVARPASS